MYRSSDCLAFDAAKVAGYRSDLLARTTWALFETAVHVADEPTFAYLKRFSETR